MRPCLYSLCCYGAYQMPQMRQQRNLCGYLERIRVNEAKSPCIGCDYEHEDKNNDRCNNCRPKIEYAVNEGMLPKEALKRFDMERQEKEPQPQRKQGKPSLVDLDVLRSMMDAGKPIKDIAEHFGVNGPSIRYHTKKLGYAARCSRIPKGTLSKSEMEEKERESEAEIAETQMAIDMADLKAEEPSEKQRGRPPKTGVNEGKKAKNKMLIKGIYIRPTEFCSDIQINEVLEGVKEIANSELRSLPQQVLWILKEKVEEWKKEHEHS